MEFEQDNNLTLPLFLLDETLSDRDLQKPDFEVLIKLTDELIAEICQNPSEDSSIAVTVSDYELKIANCTYQHLLTDEHNLHITLLHGPVLSAVLHTQAAEFVSPQMDMMPTFDLGDEDE